MLYVAFWNIPAEKTADALIVYDGLRNGRCEGVKVTSYLTADTSSNFWRVISIVETDSADTLAHLLLRLTSIGEVEIKPAIAEEDTLRVWHELKEASY